MSNNYEERLLFTIPCSTGAGDELRFLQDSRDGALLTGLFFGDSVCLRPSDAREMAKSLLAWADAQP